VGDVPHERREHGLRDGRDPPQIPAAYRGCLWIPKMLLRSDGLSGKVWNVFSASLVSTDDLATIRSLLESSGLPTSDLESAQPTFAVVHDGNTVIAAGALQTFGAAALLRSVVVASDRRGGGFGRRIVQELEDMARAAQVAQLILLTHTASHFFVRQGYRAIERSAAPLDIQMSEQFRALCPSTAVCMAKSLISPEWPE
jgi:N-acetylglutamate synthase-like GNAT family acetyltransferase